MATLLKVVLSCTLFVAVGTAVYEVRHSAELRKQVASAQKHQRAMSDEIERLQEERSQAARDFASLRHNNEQLNRGRAELLQLRGEIGRLRTDSGKLAHIKTEQVDEPLTSKARDWLTQVDQLRKRLNKAPAQSIGELQYLSDDDWLEAAREADLETDIGVRMALSSLRSSAKMRFASLVSAALRAYAGVNDGQIPAKVSQLKPYFDLPVEDAMLGRYEMLQEGRLSDAEGKWIVTEIAPVDDQYDTRYYISARATQGSDVTAYSPDHPLAQKYPSLR